MRLSIERNIKLIKQKEIEELIRNLFLTLYLVKRMFNLVLKVYLSV